MFDSKSKVTAVGAPNLEDSVLDDSMALPARGPVATREYVPGVSTRSPDSEHHQDLHDFDRAVRTLWLPAIGATELFRELESQGRAFMVRIEASELKERRSTERLFFSEPYLVSEVLDSITLPLDPIRVRDNPWDTPVLLAQGQPGVIVVENGNHRTCKVEGSEDAVLYAVYFTDREASRAILAKETESFRSRSAGKAEG